MSNTVQIQSPPSEAPQKALHEELKELVDVVGPGPLVDLLLERAFQLNATDIHLDPTTDGIRIRLRVDGLLHDVLNLPQHLTHHVVSRVKIMAGMNIAERRLSQDGHISNAVLKNQRDIRVGSGPTIHGERLVLRLMPDTSQLARPDELGLTDQQLETIQKHLKAPYGAVISAGPVGSGKTTTIYACLGELNDPHRSLVTIEDPVERQIAGTNQIQVEPKIDFDFINALRGVLRQDPDIMMVGEIRDSDTARIAIRAGLTGVLVLSTLHANDTVATIDVFREFGIPPMFIADSLNCIISQRLVRKVCPQSRETYRPDEATCRILGVPPEEAGSIELVRGIPSDANFHTGYAGRTGVFEVLSVDDDIRNAILQDKSHGEIQRMARSKGMQTLEESARQKVLDGTTTVDELHRVLTTSYS